MGKALRSCDEEEIEQSDEGLEENNEAHEIADRCISENLESVWMLSTLWAEDSLSASDPVIALSLVILNL